MIRFILLILFTFFTFYGCNGSSSSSSSSDIKNTHIVFTLDAKKLHTMSSSSYKIYDTNISKEITYESYITIDDVNIAYHKNRRIYAQNSGETTLNIYYQGKKSTFTIKVFNADILYIQASSDTYSLHKNFSSSLTCKAYFDDYTSQDISYDVSWESSDESKAKIESLRLLAINSGDVKVTAKYQNQSSFFTTKILSATMDELILSEKSLSLHEKTFHQFYARAHFSDGTDEDITKDVSWNTSTPQVALIDTNALIYAKQRGKCDIQAQIGTFTSTIAVNVLKSPPTNLKIISPKDKMTLFKENNQSISSFACFNLLIDYDDGLKQLVNRGAKWKSSDITILDIDENGCYKTLKTGKVNIEASFDDMKTIVPIIIDETEIVKLELYSPISILQEGLSASLQSIAIDKNDNHYNIDNESFWHSSNQEIISVANTKENSGQILARKNGISTLRANFGSLSASIDVTVGIPAIKELRIVPDINESVPKGYKQKLKVYAYYIDGTTQELTQSVFFKSDQEHIATISNDIADNGELEALSKGTTLITASYGAVIASLILNVTEPEVVSLIIDAPQTSIQRSESMKIKAYAIYSDGTKREFTDVVTWSTYPYNIATVSNSGNFYAVNIGKVYVTARYEDISTSRAFEVIEPKIISLIIQESANRVDVGKNIYLKAYADYKDGRRDEVTTKVEWVSFDEDLASVEDNGTVTGISIGDAKIKAFYKGHTDATTITVIRSEESIKELKIVPDINESVPKDYTQKLEVYAYYIDGTKQEVTQSVIFKSTQEQVATVSNNTTNKGELKALSEGTTLISASYGAVITSFELNVTEPEVVSLIIDAPQTSIQRSESMQIKAYAIYSDGIKREYTNLVTWSTSPSYIATVNNNGNFYAQNIGRVYVTARYEGISTSRAFEVTEPKIISLIIQELGDSVDVGKSIPLKAYANYTDGRRDEVTTKVEWVSFNESVASVEDNGIVTGVSVGDARIKALYKGHSDTTTITVFKSEQSLTIESSTTTINIGDDLQLSAMLRYSDNSVENVSDLATWVSSNDAILSIDAHGLTHALSSGTATITADYHNRIDTINITVN
jgi:hypothetical protein